MIVLEEKSRVESEPESNLKEEKREQYPSPQYDDYYYQDHDDYGDANDDEEKEKDGDDAFSNLAAIFPAPNFGSHQKDIFKKVKIDLGTRGHDYPEVGQGEVDYPYDYYQDGLDTDFDRYVESLEILSRGYNSS